MCPTCKQPIAQNSAICLLTERELAVMELIAAGYGNEYISKTLHITPRTVEHHVSSIMSKWGNLMGAEVDENGLVEGFPVHKRVKIVLIYLEAMGKIGRHEGVAEIERRNVAWEERVKGLA